MVKLRVVESAYMSLSSGLSKSARIFLDLTGAILSMLVEPSGTIFIYSSLIDVICCELKSLIFEGKVEDISADA